MFNQLQDAIKYYAETYQSMCVGSTIDDGINIAEQIAHEFKYRWVKEGFGAFPDSFVADYLRSEADAINM